MPFERVIKRIESIWISGSLESTFIRTYRLHYVELVLGDYEIMAG